MDLTESMKALAEEKVSRLERFFAKLPPDEATARIVLNKGAQNETFKVKIDLIAKGKSYFAQEKEFALETAVIRSVEEIERRLEKDRDENDRHWEELREMKSAEGLKDYVEED